MLEKFKRKEQPFMQSFAERFLSMAEGEKIKVDNRLAIKGDDIWFLYEFNSDRDFVRLEIETSSLLEVEAFICKRN